MVINNHIHPSMEGKWGPSTEKTLYGGYHIHPPSEGDVGPVHLALVRKKHRTGGYHIPPPAEGDVDPLHMALVRKKHRTGYHIHLTKKEMWTHSIWT